MSVFETWRRKPALPWLTLIFSQLIFVAIVLTSNLEKSLSFDEAFHVTSGYSHWALNDYRLTPDNGNLAKRWIALPLGFQSLDFPNENNPEWDESRQNDVARDFVFQSKNDQDQIIWSGRVMMALAGVGLCVTVFLLSRRLFGLPGAFLSLGACMFSPTIIAHSRVMTSDLISALTFLWALAALWQLLHRLTWTTLTLSALATSAVILSKFSGLIIVVIAVILAILRVGVGRVWIVSLKRGKEPSRVKSRGQQALLVAGIVLWHLVLGLFFIWLAYGFRYSMFSNQSSRNQVQQGLSVNPDELGSVGRIVGVLTSFRLAPESFTFGISSVLGHAQKRRAFLNGEVSETGWASFFPFAFLVKTSWPIFILLLLALMRVVAGPAPPGKSRVSKLFRSFYKFAPYLIFLGVFSVLAIRSSLNIGHRHILPIYPLLFLLIGSLGVWLREESLWKRGILYALGVALVIECCWIYPHYLSYFNGLVRPKNAYKHLVDSNLDWGQDLPGLRAWLESEGLEKENPGQGAVVVSYFGFAKPAYYGVKARDMAGLHMGRDIVAPRPWSAGYFCVSVSVYQTVYSQAPGPWSPKHEERYQRCKSQMERFWKAEKEGQTAQLIRETRWNWPKIFFDYEHFSVARLCAYLKSGEPSARVAYSILIFKLSPEDIKLAFDGPAPFHSEK